MGRTYAIFYPLRNLIQLTSIISRSFLCAENHKKANSNICLRKHVLNVDNIFKFICLELHSPTHRPPPTARSRCTTRGRENVWQEGKEKNCYAIIFIAQLFTILFASNRKVTRKVQPNNNRNEKIWKMSVYVLPHRIRMANSHKVEDEKACHTVI